MEVLAATIRRMTRHLSLAVLFAAVCPIGTLRAQAPPSFSPWFYEPNATGGGGDAVMARHQFDEDNGNSVFALVGEFVVVEVQAIARPDVLFFNQAHLEPPEGIYAAPGTRRILDDSIKRRGLQLYVNYSDAEILEGEIERYPSPTFFISTPGASGQPTNVQPETGIHPPVFNTLIGAHRISATRGARGVVGATVPRNSRVPLWHEDPNPWQSTHPGLTLNAIYVAAGVGYGRDEFHVDDKPIWDDVTRDRLLVLNTGGPGPNQVYLDRTSWVPPALTDGNSSCACFGDFNGDGWLDLFVGKPGDNYDGAQNQLAFWNASTSVFDDVTSAKLPAITDATVDACAYDLDGDSDLDIVVANRKPRTPGVPLTRANDYILENDGFGKFTHVQLGLIAMPSDSRSVAIGDLDPSTGILAHADVEIVIGNAGSDGFENTAVLAGDEPMQIYRRENPTGLLYRNKVFEYIPASQEQQFTSPLTQQVLLVDIGTDPESATLSPGQKATPDGRLDMVIVNSRDILLGDPAYSSGLGGVAYVLAQQNSAGTRELKRFWNFAIPFVKTVAIGDFTRNIPTNAVTPPSPSTHGNAAAYTLDFLFRGGNRFSGADSYYFENLGSSATSWPPYNSDPTFLSLLTYDCLPGNERGYGFDFADFNRDDLMDAFQAARGYDYFANGINAGSSTNWHHNVTGSSTDPAHQADNRRGRLKPLGMEDGVFADFNRDGMLDLLVASQTEPSIHYPGEVDSDTAPDTWVLRGGGALSTDMFHERQQVPILDPPISGPVDLQVDARINLNGRTRNQRPTIADRAVAGDMDNDGDVDAIVKLFQIQNPAHMTDPEFVPITLANGFTGFVEEYSFGWRYLQNETSQGQSAGTWFTDVAPTHMNNASGRFSAKWNRSLGMCLLADFDNTGTLDLFDTSGRNLVIFNGTNPMDADVTDVYQTHDLLFLNGVDTTGAPAAVGMLYEVSASKLPQAVNINPTGLGEAPGGFGCAMGDVDNDGDADIVVTRGTHVQTSGGIRLTAWPSLLINRLNEPLVEAFVDEYRNPADLTASRVPTLDVALSAAVHSQNPPGGNTLETMDDAHFPVLMDFDADGDLDLVLSIGSNVPRFFRNKGVDSDTDGRITPADDAGVTPPRLGYFEDVTTAVVGERVRPSYDANDMQAVDLDFDGDLDLAIDPFLDEVVLWRNMLPPNPAVPAATEAWPRVGAKRNQRIELVGANFLDVDQIEFRQGTAAPITVSPAVTPAVTANRLVCRIPASLPWTGLTQIRVRRTASGTSYWSTQYFGYFVLD